jgi:hypothetical protein
VQYVRSGAVPQGDSKLLYDLGITHLAVSGQQIGGKAIGDLWITYEIELKKPILESNVTSQVLSRQIEYTGGTYSGSNLFNGDTLVRGSLELTAAGNTITFPKGAIGFYQINVRIASNASGFTSFNGGSSASLVNCAPAFTVGSTSYSRNVLTTGSGTMGSAFLQLGVLIVSPTTVATVTIPTVTFAGDTIGFTQLMVMPVSAFAPQ